MLFLGIVAIHPVVADLHPVSADGTPIEARKIPGHVRTGRWERSGLPDYYSSSIPDCPGLIESRSPSSAARPGKPQKGRAFNRNVPLNGLTSVASPPGRSECSPWRRPG